MVKNSFTLILALSFALAPAFASSEYSNSQTQTRIRKAVPFTSEELIHSMDLRDFDVKQAIEELCRRGGVTAIFDKSVEGKRITAEFKDMTLGEIFLSVLERCECEAKPITDTLVLIQGTGSEYIHTRKEKEPEILSVDTILPPPEPPPKKRKISPLIQYKLASPNSAGSSAGSVPGSIGGSGLIPPPPPMDFYGDQGFPLPPAPKPILP